ncbi:MAG: class I SAM-dependent methyltransferase [Deltaproteobacteria bacterium]|nr:class I SAM-dependent methyltransferase [Deltaproteobacteria bacterium]MBW2215958.1 class I SAM-dependent methyltransferase [Deltaproteobacteria bacterium]
MKQWIKIERIPWPLTSSYEKAARMVIESYYGPMAETILSSLPKGIVLDLGTGPGYLPIEMMKRSQSIKVVGIDLSRRLIHMARANASRRGLTDNLDFEVGNAAGLRFEDSSFDMVISTGMLHSLKDPVKVFQEIYRVLKKGREAWIYDPAQIASQIDVKEWKNMLTFSDRFYLRLFTVLKLSSPSIKPYKRSQVVDMIEATDFKEYWIEKNKGEMKIRLRR